MTAAQATARSAVVRGQVRDVLLLVRARQLGVLDVLLGTVPPHLAAGAGAIRLEQLLGAAPMVGPGKTAKVLDVAGASPLARPRDLSPAHRRRLADAFREHAPVAAHARHSTRSARR